MEIGDVSYSFCTKSANGYPVHKLVFLHRNLHFRCLLWFWIFCIWPLLCPEYRISWLLWSFCNGGINIGISFWLCQFGRVLLVLLPTYVFIIHVLAITFTNYSFIIPCFSLQDYSNDQPHYWISLKNNGQLSYLNSFLA